MISIGQGDRSCLKGSPLNQLRMLVDVAGTGSFSAAGRRLGRVQSAVSQSIQLLEKQTTRVREPMVHQRPCHPSNGGLTRMPASTITSALPPCS
ncbi:LysR family transcriptional regulator [Sphingobium sp. EM0848]|uniref:helix-turn-helix domain-containing protein n=1 Tax=Sphingobium sp. EM0848 TaxID=2743473 RepID=UPI001C3FD40D|nr:LysR family transcriptional regulator [Sphingobium sp. EM0848]